VSTLNPHHHEKFAMPVDALLPRDLAATLAAHRWRTCAVVGNSGALTEGVAWGGAIDQHDVVLRINQAPTVGYDTYVRSRALTALTQSETQSRGPCLGSSEACSERADRHSHLACQAAAAQQHSRVRGGAGVALGRWATARRTGC
jgi:hypothetical protein